MANIVKDAVYGFRKTQTIIGAVKLHIFDHIHNLGGCISLEEIAKQCDADTRVIERLLNACTSMELLDKTINSDGQNCFKLNPASSLLVSSKEGNMLQLVRCVSNVPWESDAALSVAQNTKGTAEASKESNAHSTAGKSNQKCIGSSIQSMDTTAHVSTHLYRDLDMSRYPTILDLGGSSGTHARQFKKQYPESTVILADVPDALDSAKTLQANKDLDLQFVEVDLFDPGTLPKADLVFMSHVLHNWDDSESKKILSNVSSSLNPGGRVMLMEIVLTEDKTGPKIGICSDINMLLHSTGRERSFSEYKTLLKQTGFTDFELIPGGTDDIILATKS